MKSQAQIVELVRKSGVIGAGGGGFPTYVKLQAKVDTVIANGSECEPLLASDKTMMLNHADLLVEGLILAMQATGARQGIIGVKGHYENVVKALEKALPSDGSIKLHLLNNYYPAGDEFVLVYELTGRVIPEGGIPLNVGVVVNNVITLMQVAEAVNGKPVTERAVSLVGEFKKPQVVIVPIGTTYNDLIKIAGGLNIADAVLIDGGPMMGKIVVDWSLGIAKTTSGVIALPRDHFIVRMQQKSLAQMIKQSKSACCQCFRCTDLCPRNLLGHGLQPHLTMRTVDYNLSKPTENITSAFLCSQCGMCELIACDFMLLSPRKIYAAYRKELVARSIKNPHVRNDVQVCEELSNRKVAINMVLKKLDLEKYYIELPFTGKKEIKRVKVALNKHLGASAISQVKSGQKVYMTEVIAESSCDKLGSVYHASIDGVIAEVTDEYIEIMN